MNEPHEPSPEAAVERYAREADAHQLSTLFSLEAPAVSIAGYRVIREISRGGQAIVFEAMQESTNQRVAIKVQREGSLSSAAERARFDLEVQILGTLDHPDIVRILDRGVTSEGAAFFAMEYVNGRPLDQHLDFLRERDDGRDVEGQLRLFVRICDAVNAAHLRGVVHRDLKPSNIRIDEQGRPRILDFGMSQTSLRSMTAEAVPRAVSLTGQFIGSLPWASPEQADGLADRIDTRSDVYSLGVMLYQLLTGEFPYEVAGTMRDVLGNILNAQPPAPSRMLAARDAKKARKQLRMKWVRVRGVNPSMEAIVLKALSKSRADRYQSAGELSRDVASHLAGQPTQAMAIRKRRRGVRRRTLLAGVATMLIVTAAGLWLTPGWRWNPFRTSYDVAADFSIGHNPNGPWSYGFSYLLDGRFERSHFPQRNESFDTWYGSAGMIWYTSLVQLNRTGAEVTRMEIHVPPHSLEMCPGRTSEYARVRWTAPSDGVYRIEGSFWGENKEPTTTDVHVGVGGLHAFDAKVEDFGIPHVFSIEAAVRAGDPVDFAVGDGGNGIDADSTGLSAKIRRIAALKVGMATPGGIKRGRS